MARTKGRLRRLAHLAFRELERVRGLYKIGQENEKAALRAWQASEREVARLKALKNPRLVLFGWRIWS